MQYIVSSPRLATYLRPVVTAAHQPPHVLLRIHSNRGARERAEGVPNKALALSVISDGYQPERAGVLEKRQHETMVSFFTHRTSLSPRSTLVRSVPLI